ncbi:SDR family NAD(P)-dependent oxidoreductase, partial [Tahibacter harae]
PAASQAAATPPPAAAADAQPAAPAAKAAAAAQPSAATAPAAALDVAVIGVAGLLPGVSSIDEYWTQLLAGATCTGPLPARRMQLLGLAPDHLPPGEVYPAGYLDRIEYFDFERFKINAEEARAMDPQLRKLLEMTWQGVADAGYAMADFRRRRTGVFVATRGHSGYCDIPGYRQAVPQRPDAESPALYANRISNALDLTGPSEIVDTGCSSFLVAIRNAIAALRDGRCDQAVVGTAQLQLSPLDFSRGGASALFSKGDRTRSFARDSDGYIRGEVVGVIVLKRSADALAEHDSIYCTLKSVGVCHGGKSPLKWYSPNVEGQRLAIEEALRLGQVDPAQVSYVEAEANGSQLGDASEVVAIQSVYAPRDAAAGERFRISSLKPQFGHAETGSTFPALLKVMLALRHGVIPGVHGLGELNEGIKLGAGFEIAARNVAWPPRSRDGRRLLRCGAVHSLSLGGVNAHLLVEEAAAPPPPAVSAAGQSLVFVFSDRTVDGLRATVAKYGSLLSEDNGAIASLDIASFSYTLQIGRSIERHRLAIVASSVDELRSGLEEWFTGTAYGGGVFSNVGMGEADGSVRRTGHQDSDGSDVQHRTAVALAQGWVRGEKVDWRSLYRPGQLLRRLHLPANPLKETLCWRSAAGTDAAAIREEPRIGPLLLRPHWVNRPVLETDAAAGTRSRRVVFCGWPEARAEEFIAHSPGVDAAAVFAPASAQSGRRYSAMLKNVFEIVREALKQCPEGGLTLQLAIPNGLDNVCLQSLAGLLRTARREHSRLVGQLVVLDHRISPLDCRARLEESANQPDDLLVQYVRGERWVQAWKEAAAAAEGGGALPVFRRARPVVLITGGAGALGLQMARRLQREAAGLRVFLCGRSELSTGQAGRLDELRQGGHEVHYVRADLGKRDEVLALIAHIRASAGSLDGIVHCAGALRDSRIVNKRAEDLDAVFAPKVAGLCHLDEATMDLDLDFFVTFSSIVAVLGNPGQADYSMANAFMDSFAAYRNQLVSFRQRRGRTVSINWPLWHGGGMGVDAEALARLEREHGALPLPAELGADIAVQSLARKETQIAVTYGNVDRIRRSLSQWGFQ